MARTSTEMPQKSYCVVFILFALAIVQAVGYDTELTKPCDSTACFDELHGSLGDCSCKVDTIDFFNNVKIFPRIQSIVTKDYFRFYKVNLKKECPFWADDSRCAMKYCHIKTCTKESVPGYETGYNNEYVDETPATKYSKEAQSDCKSDLDHDPQLGYLNMTISAANQYEIAKWKVHDDAHDNFCENDDRDADADYVDLTLNPERYTGYKGPSAHRIWRSIYQENCFRPKLNPYESFPYVLSSDLSNLCLEKRVFYRAISGLHTSINIHLCSKFLLSEKSLGFVAPPEGEWGPNLEEFQRRFDPSQTMGESTNWLKNLYFVYLLEMRALAKAGPYLEQEEYFTGNPTEDEETRQAISNMLGVIYSFPEHFNESSMFKGGSQVETLKNEFRDHFRNISRIMDCVGCDKCKLWGKLQTQGLGTALKILFSDKWNSPEADPSSGKLPLRHKSHKKLQRTEIVALFNAFARLSNSIRELENFRIMLSRSESALNSPTEPDVSLAASLTDPLEAHTLDEARRTIRDLRMKYRAQAHQLLTWRRAHRTQEELVSRLQREKAEQLKSLSSQLLLFESRLVRKQKEITTMLALRESIIMKQQKVIESLQVKLMDNGIDMSQNIPDFRDMLQDTHITGDFDSLNDSDSAVIMEDADYDSNTSHLRFRSTNPDSVTVVRSISDAIDPNMKYSVVRRSNGFLRRPEILETVYSVEEEMDGDSTKGLSAQSSTEKEIKEANKTDEEKHTSLLAQRRDNFRMRSVVLTGEIKSIEGDKDLKTKKEKDIWSYSYVPKRMTPANDSDDEVTSNADSADEDPEPKPNHVVTYNRVMSNHRNVTKPKDVKYKRINKAKSKSLEELRGRLKNWVEKGNKLSNVPLEHAQSYA